MFLSVAFKIRGDLPGYASSVLFNLHKKGHRYLVGTWISICFFIAVYKEINQANIYTICDSYTFARLPWKPSGRDIWSRVYELEL